MVRGKGLEVREEVEEKKQRGAGAGEVEEDREVEKIISRDGYRENR